MNITSYIATHTHAPPLLLPECTHRVGDPPNTEKRKGEMCQKEHKTNETKTGTHRQPNVMYAPQSRARCAFRGRSGKAVTRPVRVSDVGDDLSWRSGFGFVMVSLARRLVNTIHRVTPRARNMHLVRFGHVNTMGKVGVEAGSEHGRGDGDAGHLPGARKRPGGND